MKKILTLMALLVAFVTTGFADTWTVAGNSAALFGTTWDPANEANDMALTDGVYTWSKSNVTLDGSNIEFKVCKDHGWGEAYPGSNWVIGSGVGEYSNGAGRYDVTITMDVNNYHAISVEIEYLGAVVIPDAEITNVEIHGSTAQTWTSDTQFTLTLVEGTDNVYTGTLDLSASENDVYFKLVVNNDNWIGYSADVVDATGLALTGENGDGSNFVLANSTTGFKTYTVTATWNPNPSATVGWTLKIEGKDERIAEITSVKVMGSFDTWGNGIELTKGTGYTYTGTIPVSADGEAFCLKVNNDTWVKYEEGGAALAETYDFVTKDNDNNFVLSGDYLSYAITATWVENPDAAKHWTLTIVPGEAREKYTYTATFVNGAGWENVYAYIWKVDGENNVKLNGDYPGVQIEKTGTETISTVEYDVYTFTFETYDETAVPQYIIFSDGGNTNKTDDLAFVNGKKYTETVPGNAEINSVVVTVTGAPVDPFDITRFKTIDADGNYVYSTDMDLSVVLDDIPFNFTINENFALPVSADMLDPSDENLLEVVEKTIMGQTYKSYVLRNNNSGFAVYTATATWTPNPSATSQWKLLVVGKTPRPTTTTYSIVYNKTGQDNGWKVGDTMTETGENTGVFTTTFDNEPGMLFAIAPTGSVALNLINQGIVWSQIIRPVVTTDNDFEVQYFHNYSDATEVKETGGKVWKIMADNTSKLTLTFTPAESTYTIVSDATEKVNITNVGWATYSLSKPFKVEDADVYIVTGVADGEADMVKLAAGAEIPAGTGVILNGDAGEYTVKPSLGNGDVAGNMLIGSGDYSYDITCVYPQEMGGGEYTAYIFANKSLGVGFYLLNSSNGSTIAPFKAFLAVPKNTNQTPAPFFGFGGEGTTGIGATLNDNGEMINDNVIYDLSGRRVENPTKGLYIINGKKVVIK